MMLGWLRSAGTDRWMLWPFTGRRGWSGGFPTDSRRRGCYSGCWFTRRNGDAAHSQLREDRVWIVRGRHRVPCAPAHVQGDVPRSSYSERPSFFSRFPRAQHAILQVCARTLEATRRPRSVRITPTHEAANNERKIEQGCSLLAWSASPRSQLPPSNPQLPLTLVRFRQLQNLHLEAGRVLVPFDGHDHPVCRAARDASGDHLPVALDLDIEAHHGQLQDLLGLHRRRQVAKRRVRHACEGDVESEVSFARAEERGAVRLAGGAVDHQLPLRRRRRQRHRDSGARLR